MKRMFKKIIELHRHLITDTFYNQSFGRTQNNYVNSVAPNCTFACNIIFLRRQLRTTEFNNFLTTQTWLHWNGVDLN